MLHFIRRCFHCWGKRVANEAKTGLMIIKSHAIKKTVQDVLIHYYDTYMCTYLSILLARAHNGDDDDGLEWAHNCSNNDTRNRTSCDVKRMLY